MGQKEKSVRALPNSGSGVTGVLLLAVCLPVMASGSTEVVSRQEAPAEGLKVNSSWKQIRSGDFVVASDASEVIMRKALAEIEGFKHAIQVLTPWRNMTSAVPTVLVLFKNAASFDDFKPRDADGDKRELVGGYFLERPHVNYMVTFVRPGGALDLGVILHAMLGAERPS